MFNRNLISWRPARPAAVLLGLASLCAPALIAQKFEVGGGGGGPLYLSRPVRTPTVSANTGFDNGFAFGGWVGHDTTDRIGGEIHYLHGRNDLKLSSGGTKINFSGLSHALHYDVLVYGAPRGAKIRPFVAVGGGIKGYYGTGKESAFQPLSNLALLTRTRQWQGLATFGGGVKVAVGRHSSLRFEVLDYLTPFPKDVIAPAPGAKLGGWLHNFVPVVGLSATF